SSSGMGVKGFSSSSYGVYGQTGTGTSPGVYGLGYSSGVGVQGTTLANGTGVMGNVSGPGTGVAGSATGGGTGASGVSDTSTGVYGQSGGWYGVQGVSNCGTNGSCVGVYGV